MSELSRQYQVQITGHPRESWVQNGVKFDGMIDGTLVDAKCHYVQFVDKTTGKFYDWFAGKNALIEQAQRQIVASEGAPIKWFFAEEESMEAFKSLLSGNGIEGIEFVFEPLK